MTGAVTLPICSMPFTSPVLVPAGFKFCCLPHLPQGETIDYWNGEEARAVRREFLAGGVPDLCKACVKANKHLGQQPNGGQRQYTYEEVVPVDFRTLSIARSNVCNNACEMCRSDLSTTFGRENGGYVKVENNFDLSPYYHQMEYVYFSGGNPVQDPGVLELLRKLPKATVKYLMFTSNGSLFPIEYIDELRKFRDVHICFSIDAHKELNAQLRKYSNHERTYKTIRTVLPYVAPGFKVSIQQTLTCKSVRTLYRLYQELKEYLPINQLAYSPNPCIWPEQLSLERLTPTDLFFIDNQLALFAQEQTTMAKEMSAMLERIKSYILAK